MYPSVIADKAVVRFPDGLRKMVQAKAAENGRSMNAEIIYRLRQAYGLTENEKADATAS